MPLCSLARTVSSRMVLFRAYAGNAAVVRDARGAHDLCFGADDRGDDLHGMAPGIFVGGGATPVSCTYGQFASLLLASVARLSPAGALTKTFATHRCSDAALARLWSTALEILAGLPLGATSRSSMDSVASSSLI